MYFMNVRKNTKGKTKKFSLLTILVNDDFLFASVLIVGVVNGRAGLKTGTETHTT